MYFIQRAPLFTYHSHHLPEIPFKMDDFSFFILPVTMGQWPLQRTNRQTVQGSDRKYCKPVTFRTEQAQCRRLNRLTQELTQSLRSLARFTYQTLTLTWSLTYNTLTG